MSGWRIEVHLMILMEGDQNGISSAMVVNGVQENGKEGSD